MQSIELKEIVKLRSRIKSWCKHCQKPLHCVICAISMGLD